MTPLHLLAGFLGAGKTTALKHQLSVRSSQRIAILVNDFGESRFDYDVLLETDAVRVLDIPGGCLCCTAPEGFVEAVRVLLDEVRPDRIFVEPTGLALPADLLDTLRRAPFADRLHLMPVVVLVDPSGLPDGEGWPPVIREQLEVADILVANRTDLAGPEAMERFERVVASLWPPPLRVIRTRFGVIDPADLEGPGPGRGPTQHDRQLHPSYPGHDHPHADHAEHDHPAVHGHHARSWTWGPTLRFDRDRLGDALARLATGGGGAPLARLKGVFQTDEGVWKLEIAGAHIHEAPSSFRRGSRVDVICRSDKEPAWERVESLLTSALATAAPAGDELEVIGPTGRIVHTGESLARIPGGVPDVGMVVPGRKGRAAPLAAVLAQVGGVTGELVAVARDGFVSKPVAVSEAAGGWLVYGDRVGPLAPGDGGPVRLLVPDATGSARSCANVKGVCRLIVRSAC